MKNELRDVGDYSRYGWEWDVVRRLNREIHRKAWYLREREYQIKPAFGVVVVHDVSSHIHEESRSAVVVPSLRNLEKLTLPGALGDHRDS